MQKKTYRFETDTINTIKSLKDRLNLTTEKEVVVMAIEQLAISKMVKTNTSNNDINMDQLNEKIDRLYTKLSKVDENVMVSNLYHLSDFIINQHPTDIISRDLFNDNTFINAKKEVTKLIRENVVNSNTEQQSLEKKGDSFQNEFDF